MVWCGASRCGGAFPSPPLLTPTLCVHVYARRAFDSPSSSIRPSPLPDVHTQWHSPCCVCVCAHARRFHPIHHAINASSDGRIYHQVENFECKLKKSKEIKITSLNGFEIICNSWTQFSVRFKRGSNKRFEPEQKKSFLVC